MVDKVKVRAIGGGAGECSLGEWIEMEKAKFLLIALLTFIAFQGEATTLGGSPFAKAVGESGVVRALSVANDAFLDGLPRSMERASEIDRFASNPGNYRVTIDYEGGKYVIDYEIKPFKGAGFRGGGYRFVVDGASYQVVKTVVSP